jgi:hypothetical protein
VHQGVTEFSALVDGAWCLGGRVTGDATGKGKLAEQLPHTLGIRTVPGVNLAVRALQLRVGNQARPAVARARDVDDVRITLADDPIEVRIDKVQPGGGALVSEQSWFDVLNLKRFSQ